MNKLNELIKRVGGSDKDTATVLGRTPASVSEWKAGKREIPKYTLNHIEDLLNSSQSYLKRIIKERVGK